MIKATIATLLGKIASFILKKGFKKGTSLPGKIAMKISPDIMKYLVKNKNIVFITGTNGKTTTTSMVYQMAKQNGIACFSNDSGANIEWGIITTFIDHYHFFSNKKEMAIIEIDEANVPLVCKYVKPDYLCITNLFRDQLDRYGEVYTTLDKILTGVKYHPETILILNGDEPLLGKLDIPNKKIYYGFNVSNNHEHIEMNTDAKHCKECQEPYEYEFITYNHLGKYHCPHCGYHRPELDDAINEIKEMLPYGSKVVINQDEIQISQAGMYNIYNGLCAYSVAKALGIKTEIIKDVLAHQESRFGRQEVIQIDDKIMTIFLVKNPAGFNQTIDTIGLDQEPFSCLFMLNDHLADGQDVSWIYDVHLEKLTTYPIQNYYIGGDRAYDMAIRLEIVTKNKDQLQVYLTNEQLLNAIKQAPTKRIYATLTYTAMLDFRRYLESQGYIKEYWR